MMPLKGHVVDVKDLSIMLTSGDNIYDVELNVALLSNDHHLVYLSGINTQAIIPRHTAFNPNTFEDNNNEHIRFVLQNIDTTYCVPYYKRLFTQIKNYMIPEYMY